MTAAIGLLLFALGFGALQIAGGDLNMADITGRLPQRLRPLFESLPDGWANIDCPPDRVGRPEAFVEALEVAGLDTVTVGIVREDAWLVGVSVSDIPPEARLHRATMLAADRWAELSYAMPGTAEFDAGFITPRGPSVCPLDGGE